MVEVQDFQGAPLDLFTRRYASFSDVHTDFFMVMPGSAFADVNNSRAYTYGNARVMAPPAPGMLPDPQAAGFAIDQAASGYDQMVHVGTGVGVAELATWYEDDWYGYGMGLLCGYPGVDLTGDITEPVKITWPHVMNVYEMNDWNVYVTGPLYCYMGFEASPDAPADQAFINSLGFTSGYMYAQLNCYPLAYPPTAGQVPEAERHAAVGFIKRGASTGLAADITAADVAFGMLMHGTVGQFIVSGVVVQTFAISDWPEYELYFDANVVAGLDITNPANLSSVEVEVGTAYVYAGGAADTLETFSGNVTISLADCVLGAWADWSTGVDSMSTIVLNNGYFDGDDYPSLTTGFYQSIANPFWAGLHRAVEIA